MEEIAQETSKDPALALVKRQLQGELLSSTGKELIKSFDRVTNELSITRQGIMLRGTRIVIPTTLQDKMLSLAHEGHLGITKTKALLRTKVWFLEMSSRVKSLIKNC